MARCPSTLRWTASRRQPRRNMSPVGTGTLSRGWRWRCRSRKQGAQILRGRAESEAEMTCSLLRSPCPLIRTFSSMTSLRMRIVCSSLLCLRHDLCHPGSGRRRHRSVRCLPPPQRAAHAAGEDQRSRIGLYEDRQMLPQNRDDRFRDTDNAAAGPGPLSICSTAAFLACLCSWPPGEHRMRYRKSSMPAPSSRSQP